MRSMRNLLLAAAAGALALSSSALLAHSDGELNMQRAPNGGQLRMAGAHHFELVVAKDGPVVVFVTDHTGAKVATAGASGTATILAGKQKTAVALVPDGDNRLKGIGNHASTPDMKVVVSITLPGKAAEQARFTPLAASKAVAKDEHAEHKH